MPSVGSNECPQCRTQTGLAAAYCPRCGYSFQAAPPEAETVLPAPAYNVTPPVLPAATGPMVDSNFFVCVVSGNPNVQRVSAIWQTGSWASVSAGVSYSYGHLSGGGSLNTVGVSSMQHAGAT